MPLLLLAVAGGGGWWWYQEREAAGIHSGHGPAPVADGGQILIDARPWGRIDRVVETGSGKEVPLPAGSPFTPRRATLPEGSYEITLHHPDAGSRSCRVETRKEARQDCKVRFLESDPHAYFRELGW